MLRRLSALYLWLTILSSGPLSLIHDLAGLRAVIGISMAHLLVLGLALWAVADSVDRQAQLAGRLLIVGGAVLWSGAATWPGSDLKNIAVRRADDLWTSGCFLLGAVLMLAGFTVLTAALRRAGGPLLAELGLWCTWRSASP